MAAKSQVTNGQNKESRSKVFFDISIGGEKGK